MKPYRLATLVVAVTLGLCNIGQAVVLNIDFGHQDLAAGFEAFTQPGGTYGSAGGSTVVGPISQPFTSALGVGGSVTVELSAAGGDDSERLQSFYGGYPASGVEYRDVAEDCVYNIGGASLDLEFDALKAGSYRVTTFLHSSNYGFQGKVDIDVIDMLGTRQVFTDFSQSYGTAGPVAQAAMLCVSDGINPITIHFDEASNPKNVVLSGVTIAEVPEGPLKVDFGHSNVEAGFEQFHTPGGPDTGFMSNYTTNSPVEQEFLSALGNTGVVAVELTSGGRGATHRLSSFHSGDMSGPYPYRDLGKDLIYNIGDDWLEVTLSDLEAGQYEFDAFLHSSYSAQGDVNIDLTDRYGTLDRVVSDFTQSSDSAGPVAQASFFLYANGIDDVVIRLTETNLTLSLGSRNVVMAGFILTPVPEPGSMLLLAIGGLMLAALVRRRRPTKTI